MGTPLGERDSPIPLDLSGHDGCHLAPEVDCRGPTFPPTSAVGASGAGSLRSSAVPSSPTPGTLLFIGGDDTRLSEAAALTDAGFSMIIKNAETALATAQRRPDLVIVALDDTAASSIIGDLRTDPLTEDLPILEWATHPTGPDDLVRSLGSGATMLIGEPTTPELLVTVVRAMLESRDRQREFEIALSTSDTGIFEWIIPTGVVTWTESLEKIHGLAPGEFGGTFEDFLSFVDPSEHERVGTVINMAVERGTEYAIVYRGRRNDGGEVWIDGRGRVFRDLDGNAAKLIGVATDVTSREESVDKIDEIRKLAGALNAKQSADAVMTTLSDALERYGRVATVYDADHAIPSRPPQTIRRRTDHFVLDIGPAPLAPVNSRTDIDQIITIADLALHALRRGVNFDLERETAATFQRALLPAHLPEVDGWLIDADYEPAAAADDRLGGDFYDLVVVGDRIVAFIGDVAGHGLEATAQMSSVRNLLRVLALQYDADPAAILGAATDLVDDLLPASTVFVTTLVVSVDLADGTLLHASAGHPPPVLRRADGSSRALEVSRNRPPLGIGGSADVPATGTATLAPGDALILYTDGVIERRDESLGDSIERLERNIADAEAPIRAADVLDIAAGDTLNPDDRATLCLNRLR